MSQAPILRLANIGHNHLQNNIEITENVLSIGVGSDVLRGISHFAESGLIKVGLHNIDTVCYAFEQMLNIKGLSFLESVEPANLGLFSLPLLPKPYIGTAKRQGRNRVVEGPTLRENGGR